MYNINSPSLRGNNVSADQASYDLVFKDFIINNIEPYTKFLDEKKKTKKLATKKTDSECDFVD